jgi:hypothetical protein
MPQATADFVLIVNEIPKDNIAKIAKKVFIAANTTTNATIVNATKKAH